RRPRRRRRRPPRGTWAWWRRDRDRPYSQSLSPPTPGRRKAGGRGSVPRPVAPAWSAAALADLLDRLRDHLEQITDDAEVGDLEDRRLRVLVDRHDDPRGLHTGPVLDRAGDPQRDVQLRRDRLAGLADLVLVGVEAGVGRRAGRPDRATQQVGELLDEREVLRAADAAPTG